MKKRILNIIKTLSFAALMLVTIVASIGIEDSFAAENGIYLATAQPHYRHPYTGTIEDSGGENSYVLGQSMTESALNSSALVEVDPAGNTFITIRMNLMDNINNPNFQVDAAGNGGFYSVGASVMQEDFGANTADFRMQVPSEYCVIRCNMYVIPMGREVVFYITVGGLSPGSGDFVTSVSVEEPSAPDTPQVQTPSPAPSASGNVSSSEQSGAPSENNAGEDKKTEGSSDKKDSSSKSDEDKKESSSKSDEGKKESTSGITEFDAKGNKKEESKPAAAKKADLRIPILAGVLIVGGGAATYGVLKKRNKR